MDLHWSATKGSKLTENRTSPRDKVFLVIVRDVLVGQDLAQTILDEYPAAHVIVVASPEDAMVALADVTAIEIAFVAAEPQTFDASPLERALVIRQGKVVLMGSWSDTGFPLASWRMLPFPFTTADVRCMFAPRRQGGTAIGATEVL